MDILSFAYSEVLINYLIEMICPEDFLSHQKLCQDSHSVKRASVQKHMAMPNGEVQLLYLSLFSGILFVLCLSGLDRSVDIV